MSEWDSVFSADGIHYRPDNGEPIQVQVELMENRTMGDINLASILLVAYGYFSE